MENFAGWIIGWWESGEEWFWTFETFSKLITKFWKYWTAIKTKIIMTRVYKEYEDQNGIEAMALVKNENFIEL